MPTFFDDFEIGTRFELGRHTFTAGEIVTFARAYDPQFFHTDAEAARLGPFGALCASGWHTAAVCMRQIVAWRDRQEAQARANGEPLGILGPSPGFRDLKWLKPVFAGDTIAYASEVAEKRVSSSRPGWGIVVQHISGTNQHGERVFSFVSSVFSQRRG